MPRKHIWGGWYFTFSWPFNGECWNVDQPATRGLHCVWAESCLHSSAPSRLHCRVNYRNRPDCTLLRIIVRIKIVREMSMKLMNDKSSLYQTHYQHYNCHSYDFSLTNEIPPCCYATVVTRMRLCGPIESPVSVAKTLLRRYLQRRGAQWQKKKEPSQNFRNNGKMSRDISESYDNKWTNVRLPPKWWA